MLLQQQLSGKKKSQWPRWYEGMYISSDSIYDFIVRSAERRGMNVQHVLTVISGEGGWDVPNQQNYNGEPAWGPLQLHVAAEDYRPGFEGARKIAQETPQYGYVGDQFIYWTGLHPRDPRAYKMAVEFGLDYAIRAGTWAAWYGAKYLPDGRFTAVQGKVLGFTEEAREFAGVN